MENDDKDMGTQEPRVIESASTKISKSKNRKRLLLIISVLIVLVLSAVVAWMVMNDGDKKTPTTSNQNPPAVSNPGVGLDPAEVSYTEDGFVPNTIRVKAGQTVKWTNDHAGLLVVASDPHPEHTDVDGLESESIDQDADYSYTFAEPGTFTYHNHLDPTAGGTVIVEE